MNWHADLKDALVKSLLIIACMQIEVERFPNGNLKVIVRFEPSSNFWKKDLTWCPSMAEIELLVHSLFAVDGINRVLMKYRGK